MSVDTIAGVDILAVASVAGVTVEAAGTLTPVRHFMIPDYLPTTGPTNNHVIDASGEKTAAIFAAPKSGNIDRVVFATGTVTTGATVPVRLETVGADGLPTGTLVAANTSGTQVIANADDNTYFEVTLTAAAAVTKGTKYAIVIEWAASANLNIGYATSQVPDGPVWGAYSGLFTSSWTMNSARAMLGAVRYDDATYPYIPGASVALSTTTNVQYNSGSTPDERGNLFTAPFDCKVAGIWASMSNFASATDTYDLILYDSGSSILESITNSPGLNAINPFTAHYFDTEVTLTAGSTYRVTMKPTSANSIGLLNVPMNSSYISVYLGTDTTAWQLTTRTDGGAWTDTPNTIAGVGLIVSEIIE